jgi:hypothetical protein
MHSDFGVRRREHPSAAAAPGTPPVAALVLGILTPKWFRSFDRAVVATGRDRAKALTGQRTPKGDDNDTCSF